MFHFNRRPIIKSNKALIRPFKAIKRDLSLDQRTLDFSLEIDRSWGVEPRRLELDGFSYNRLLESLRFNPKANFQSYETTKKVTFPLEEMRSLDLELARSIFPKDLVREIVESNYPDLSSLKESYDLFRKVLGQDLIEEEVGAVESLEDSKTWFRRRSDLIRFLRQVKQIDKVEKVDASGKELEELLFRWLDRERGRTIILEKVMGRDHYMEAWFKFYFNRMLGETRERIRFKAGNKTESLRDFYYQEESKFLESLQNLFSTRNKLKHVVKTIFEMNPSLNHGFQSLLERTGGKNRTALDTRSALLSLSHDAKIYCRHPRVERNLRRVEVYAQGYLDYKGRCYLPMFKDTLSVVTEHNRSLCKILGPSSSLFLTLSDDTDNWQEEILRHVEIYFGAFY